MFDQYSDRTSAARVLLVTRRYWPLTDDSAGRICMLAEGLMRSGLAPKILAPRFASLWPEEIDYREVPVIRPVAAPRGEWTTGVYHRSLVKYLKEHAAEYDLFYSDAMREEGLAVAEVAKLCGKPAVVRCSGSNESGDWYHAKYSRSARRAFNGSMQADAIVSPHATAARSLIACGADSKKLCRIADGIPAAIRCEPADRIQARAALAAINSDLRVPSNGAVAIISGRFEHQNRILFAAEALATLCNHIPGFRIWFIGDGQQRDALHQYLKDVDVRSACALPGSFWHIEELIRAADLAIFPSDSDSLEHRLPMAISGGLPVVLVDTPETRGFLGHLKGSADDILTFAKDDPDQLRAVVQALLENYESAQQRAQRIRNYLRRVIPREQSIEAHARLFSSLIASYYPASDFNREPTP